MLIVTPLFELVRFLCHVPLSFFSKRRLTMDSRGNAKFTRPGTYLIRDSTHQDIVHVSDAEVLNDL